MFARCLLTTMQCRGSQEPERRRSKYQTVLLFSPLPWRVSVKQMPLAGFVRRRGHESSSWRYWHLTLPPHQRQSAESPWRQHGGPGNPWWGTGSPAIPIVQHSHIWRDTETPVRRTATSIVPADTFAAAPPMPVKKQVRRAKPDQMSPCSLMLL